MDEHEDSGEISIDIKATSIKDIQMEQFRRITKLSSVELRGGFWTKIITKDKDEKEVYIEDTREVLSNAILCLAFLTRTKFDDKMEIDYKDYKDKFQKKKEEFLKITSIEDKQILGEGYYNDKEKKLLEEFKIEKLFIHQELYANLCLFLGRVPLGITGGVIE